MKGIFTIARKRRARHAPNISWRDKRSRMAVGRRIEGAWKRVEHEARLYGTKAR